jgi:hypothetical protein
MKRKLVDLKAIGLENWKKMTKEERYKILQPMVDYIKSKNK